MKKIYLMGYKSSPSRYEFTYKALSKINSVSLTSQFFFDGNTYQKASIIKRCLGFLLADIIYIGPMEHRICSLLLCKMLRKKIVCDIYAGLYDMTVIDRKLYGAQSLRGRIQYIRDRIAMKWSSVCIFLTEAEKKHFLETVNLKECEVNATIIPLVTNAKNASKLPFFHGDASEITLCWTGTYIPLQGFDTIIEAMDILRKRDFRGRLVVYGPNTSAAEQYKRIVREKQLQEFIRFENIWGNLEKWERQIVDTCDISIGIFGTSDKAKTVLANKVLDGVTFRTPVITGHSKGAKEFFDGISDIYYCVTEPMALADTIEMISKVDLEIILKKVNNAFQVYNDYFSPQKFSERIRVLISNL